MQRSYFIATIYSLIIHILIILSLFNYVKSIPPKPIGYKNIVQAYVMPEPMIIAKQQTYPRHLSIIPIHHPVIPAKAGDPKNQSRLREDDHLQRKSGNPEQLIIILHNKIQQQINNINYDLPVALNKRTADIRFLLTPEGIITNISIIKSSGVLFLDNLALQAVRAIEPYAAAKKYLAVKSYFKVKVYYNPH